SSREMSSCATASHGNMQTSPANSRADRNLGLAGVNRSDCAMRLGRFSRSQRQRSDTAESRQNAYEYLTLRRSRRGLGAVIRMTGKDRDRPVDLLGKNDARKSVRQGHLAERKDEIRLVERRRTDAVGPAHEEGKTRRAAVAKLGEALREGLARHRGAFAVEAHQPVRRWALGKQRLGLGLHAHLRT